MSRKTNELIEYHVYQLGDLLLEASYCDVWTLVVLAPNGEYAPKEHGALVAYQLRDDGLWDSVYHFYSQQGEGEPAWAFSYGDTMHIDTSLLRPVADTRLYVQADFYEQELERRFREIMAEMNW